MILMSNARSMNPQRIFHHLKRYKTEFLYTSLILSGLTLLYSSLYPGEETMVALTDVVESSAIKGLLSQVDLKEPGWGLWISISASMYLYFTLATASILIGAKIIPTRNREGVELFLGSSSLSARKYYVENLIAGIGLIVAIALPSYLIVAIFSIIHGSSDILGRLALAYLFSFVVATVFLVISSAMTVLRFNRSAGILVGFAYLVVALMTELSFGSSSNNEKLANFSANYYAKATVGIISGKFDWEPIAVLSLIILAVIAGSIWYVKFPDYIEKDLTDIGSDRRSLNPANLLLAPSSKAARRFPVVFDQFRNDFGKTIVFFLIIVGFVAAIVVSYPGDAEMAKALTAFENPTLLALMHNHEIRKDYTGFMQIKFYSMYYAYHGLYTVLVAASIPNRDARTDTQDLLWANNLSPDKLVRSRTVALIIEYSLMHWISYLFVVWIEKSADVNVNFTHEFQAFFVLWIHMLGLGVFTVAIAMLPKIQKGRKYALITYMAFVFLIVTAYADASLEFLKYFSYFAYFDMTALHYGVADFPTAILKSSMLLVLSGLFMIGALKLRFSKGDLI